MDTWKERVGSGRSERWRRSQERKGEELDGIRTQIARGVCGQGLPVQLGAIATDIEPGGRGRGWSGQVTRRSAATNLGGRFGTGHRALVRAAPNRRQSRKPGQEHECPCPCPARSGATLCHIMEPTRQALRKQAPRLDVTCRHRGPSLVVRLDRDDGAHPGRDPRQELLHPCHRGPVPLKTLHKQWSHP